MKAKLPKPEHYSYFVHRRQRNTQIILPVVLGALAFIGMIVLVSLATFNSDGDVGRWAAISTIWIILPMMIAGLILLAILIVLIILLARALGILPYYTGVAQDAVHRAGGYIMRAADLAVKPILVLNGWAGTIKAFLGRIRP
jgi:uncharacterized membrane protein